MVTLLVPWAASECSEICQYIFIIVVNWLGFLEAPRGLYVALIPDMGAIINGENSERNVYDGW